MTTLPSVVTSELQDTSLAEEPSSPATESSLTFTDKSDLSDNSFAVIGSSHSLPTLQRAIKMDGHSTSNSNGPTRHAELYMNEGMVEIQVQTTLYRVPAYALVRDSEYFHTLLKDYGSMSASDSVHIDDEDVTSIDFERFLLLVYPRLIGDFAAKTCEEWTSVLHLATKWGFTTIRDLAIKQVFPLASDIDRIVIGRKYGLDGWLLDAFVSVCSRPEPLSLSEARRMSLEDVVRIGQGHAAIRPDAQVVEPARARETIGELVEITDEVANLKEATDVGTSPPVPINKTPTHDSFVSNNSVLERAKIPQGCAMTPITAPSDDVLKFASLLTTCEKELKKTYDQWQSYLYSNGHYYQALHLANQKSTAQKLKDMFPSYTSNSVDLKHCIALIINEGVSTIEDPISFHEVLAEVCQSLPGLTDSTIEATIEHHRLNGRALATQYLYDAFYSDIMSWTQPDAGFAHTSDATVHARQKSTITFLQKLAKLNALPDGAAALYCHQLLALQNEMTNVTQASQLIDLLRLAGKLVDTPEADNQASLDAIFARLGHLRLNPRFRSIHNSISSLIELRQNGWST